MTPEPTDEPKPRRRRRRRLRLALYLITCTGCAMMLPSWWCGRDAAALYRGQPPAQAELAAEVAGWLDRGVDETSFATGDDLFNGEWALVTYQMAALGLGQVALEQPDRRAAYLVLVERCIEQLLQPALRRFGASRWHEDGLAAAVLARDHGHAYLGYLNLALGMLRRLDPATRHGPLHDRLTAALARRLAASPFGMIETYPGESYPADVAAVVGSIGLHGRATGADHRTLLRRWAQLLHERYRDHRSGLLYQSADARSGRPTGLPRGSGTAVAIYFLSFADPDLSRELFTALRRQRHVSLWGFGGVREYPAGTAAYPGDVDSGPVLFGVSVSASGFALAGARLHGDFAVYQQLYRTAYLFGAPLSRNGRRGYVTGGPLGNAILLAMLTANPLPAGEEP